ncbi:hypothetical protein BH11BAC7_BH11BAC7_34870 [soil metagenome]
MKAILSMKKAILFLLCCPLLLFAQEIPSYTNEIGVNLFSVKRFEHFHGADDRMISKADFNLIPGIYYKWHFGKNALRTSFDYSQKAIHRGSIDVMDPYSTQYFSASRKNFDLAIGYERAFAAGKFQPYLFSDLIVNYENYTGERMNIGCFGPYGITQFSEEKFEYGISLGAGLRYNITSRIHISLELDGRGFVSVFQDLHSSYDGDKYVDHGFHFDPVNKMGFSYSF